MSGRPQILNSCEMFDISSGNWINVHSMEFPRASTSMCTFNNRHVFIFHGLSLSINTTGQNCIEYLDLGPLDLNAIKQARWSTIPVSN